MIDQADGRGLLRGRPGRLCNLAPSHIVVFFSFLQVVAMSCAVLRRTSSHGPISVTVAAPFSNHRKLAAPLQEISGIYGIWPCRLFETRRRTEGQKPGRVPPLHLPIHATDCCVPPPWNCGHASGEGGYHLSD